MDQKDLQQIREEFVSVIEGNIHPQLDDIRVDIGTLKDDVGTLKDDVGTLKDDVVNLKDDVLTIKNQMVTKSYLDDKLADLGGNFTVRLRKEDAKVNRLVEIMGSKKLLNQNEVKELDGFQVFPNHSI